MTAPTPTYRIDWGGDGSFADLFDVITTDVIACNWKRGRSADFGTEATGSAGLTLDNRDDFYTSDRNWHDNPSFEQGTTGWLTGAIASLTAAATSITQVTDNASVSSGTKAGEAVLTASSNSGVYYKIPYIFRNGITYSVSVWLKSMSGNLNVRAGLASYGTPADIASTGSNITTSWASYTFTWTPSGDRSDAVFFVRTTTAAVATVRIDAINVNPGATVNTYLEAPTKGQLVPGKPVHLYATYSAVDYAQFYGFIERITPDPAMRRVTIQCYDVLRLMQNTDVLMMANGFVARSPRDCRLAILDDFERGALNVCTNPEFTTNTTGWTTSGGDTLTRTTSDGPDGITTTCGRYVPTSNNGASFVMRLIPNFFSGQVYRFSVYARSESGTPVATLTVTTSASSASSPVTLSTSWQRFSVAYTLPTDIAASSGPTVSISCASTIRFTAVQITRGQALYPYATVGTGRWPNLCGNGSFDGNALSGWYDGWTNAITNGSFETNTTGWLTTTDAFITTGAATLTRDTGTHSFGTASGKVVSSGANSGARFAITGTFISGQLYACGVTLTSDVTGTTIKPGIGSQGTPADTASATQQTISTTPVAFTWTWTPSSNRTDAHFYVKFIGTGNVWIDGAYVFRRDAAATTDPKYSDTGPGGGGSFNTTRAVSTTQAKYGYRAQSIVTPATATAGRVYDFNQYGTYFVGGQPYTASVWLYPSSNMAYKVGLAFDKGDGTFEDANTTGTATANTWTQVTVSITPSQDYSSATAWKNLLYIYQTDTTSRTFYIDGVRVIPAGSADNFEQAYWNLATGAEATDSLLNTAVLVGSALSCMSSLNTWHLSRHWITPKLTTPFYQYNTHDRTAYASLATAETFDFDSGVNGASINGLDVDGASITNVVPVTSSLGSRYYSDGVSVGQYGVRPSSALGASYLDGSTNLAAVDDIGNKAVVRHKDPRPRPQVMVTNRWPSQLQRDLDDNVVVNCARLGIYGAEYLIQSIETTITEGGQRWDTIFTLEESAY